MTAQAPPRKDSEYLTTLERGLTVLRSFTKERPEMTLSEVAAATSLSPAVARRCLNTLVQLGYVGKQGKQFLLTPNVLDFALAFQESMNLEQVVRPHLQDVRDALGDSASLAVLSGFDILYLVHISTNRMFRVVAGYGTRFPAYPTSLGRVLLAYQHPEDIDHYLAHAELRRLTDKTETSPIKLRNILEEVREQGFSSIQDQLDYGIVSVSVPVMAPDGEILAAINCSTATTRVTEQAMVETRLPPLREAAARIEAEVRRYPVLEHSIRAAALVSGDDG